MKAINVEIDNEYFMVKVERKTSNVFIQVFTVDQSKCLYSEQLSFWTENHCQQFELDFDKRDAKKTVTRYLKCR